MPSKIWERRNGADWNLIQREFWTVVTYLGRFGPTAQTERSCTWSHSSLFMETFSGFHEQTDPLPCIHPPSTSVGVLVGLAVLCLSGLIGLTCSLYMSPSTRITRVFLMTPELSLPPVNGSVVCSKDILSETCCFCGAQSEFRLFYTEKEVVFEFPAVPPVLPDTFPWGRTQFGVKVESSATGQSCISADKLFAASCRLTLITKRAVQSAAVSQLPVQQKKSSIERNVQSDNIFQDRHSWTFLLGILLDVWYLYTKKEPSPHHKDEVVPPGSWSPCSFLGWTYLQSILGYVVWDPSVSLLNFEQNAILLRYVFNRGGGITWIYSTSGSPLS